MSTDIRGKKFDAWRHGLLDITRRNRLINYRRTIRTTLRITYPAMGEMYRRLVVKGEKISFRRQIDTGGDPYLERLFYIMDKMNAPVELAEGEIKSDLGTADMNVTLKNLRAKARLSQEEQGINTLYLCFGFLRWREKPSDPYMLSPLVLVPAALETATIMSPFFIKKLDEDIVVNPTLEYVLSSQYGIVLPEPDAAEEDIEGYLDRVEAAVSSFGWAVEKEADMGLLSFLKIVMYKDLEKYRDQIFRHPVIRAFCGDGEGLPKPDGNARSFPHDSVPAGDVCRVVSADASQQDAIRLSRQGVSFVLQGPPGTGKSQTITNIIAQALSDGKKVLFVSEKMAALSVVYRRLEEVGLADRCLSLHNYRAEKRAVLKDLVRTMDLAPAAALTDAADDMNAYESARDRLNGYVEEMDRVRGPLDKSVFDAVTELVSLGNGPFFRIVGEASAVSRRDYAARIGLLKRYAEHMENEGAGILSNPWRGAGVSAVTYDVRETVSSGFAALGGSLFGLSGALAFMDRGSGRTGAFSMRDVEKLLEHILAAELCRRTAAELDTELGLSLFSPENAEEIKKAAAVMNGARKKALAAGVGEGAMDDAASRRAFLEATGKELAGCEECIRLMKRLSEILSLPGGDDRAALVRARDALKILALPGQADEEWFREGRLEEIRTKARMWKELADRTERLKRKIDADWEPGFLEADYRGLLLRFTGEYETVFKFLNVQYWNDKSALTALRRDRPARLDDSECVEGLLLLKEYRETLEKCGNETKDVRKALGSLYRGAETDWNALLSILDDYAAACLYFKRYGTQDKIKTLLLKSREERLADLSGKPGWMDAAAELLDSRIKSMETPTLSSGAAVLMQKRDAVAAYNDAYAACAKTLEPRMTRYMAAKSPGVPRAAEALSAAAGKAAEARKDAEAFFDLMGAGPLPENMEDLLSLWEERIDSSVLDGLAVRLKEAYLGLDGEAFTRTLSSVSECVRLPEEEHALKTLSEWFPEEDLYAYPLDALRDRIARCGDIEALEKWIGHMSLVRECADRGLKDYIEYIEKNGVAPGEIVPLYRRSFMTRWLMEELSGDRAERLRAFRSYAHEKTAEEFRTEDAKQLKLARERLSAQLSAAISREDLRSEGSVKEEALLRRESEKKRRVIPLRRLFRAIPGLMQRLKPCFMMSPLSVSYFLDAELYHFDLVIFDEASQILPEDAVGAIFRGRQAIIAGDTRQMPPTDFFNAAVREDEEPDEDDEYFPDAVSESVLDEAAACLPACTLLWHYRSRDESLIAFSNRLLYHDSLITFPNCSHMKDRGVEYIYVPNGCYEGSGRNCNVAEARRCLSLVEEHLRNHPDRSLGIVAFSEKQQSVIEEIIEDFRMKNPRYESFFDETRDEPFFVKNLENVQGDERDTIIFSVCYARNSQGRMYQRFGPLSHEGGERRLNVAITRAKYNVKLVGSVMPTDIAVKEGTGEGVRMLKEYIYYAMQNDCAVSRGNPSGEGEGFADRIADFLKENGYTVRRNIGASAYKLDIAVEKPGSPDILIAGVECDGPHYRDTRTAHDRDVLRKDIMTSLGWRMIHVWSMAWYLNPETEKNRLLDFIRRCRGKDADNHYALPELIPPEKDTVDDKKPREARCNQTEGVLTIYEYADPLMVSRDIGADSYANLAAAIRYVLEREAPIYAEELYTRIAPLFGSPRVTGMLRKVIDDCAFSRLGDCAERRGEFLYIKGARIYPRVPREGDVPRSADRIAPEEIRAMLGYVLAAAPGRQTGGVVEEAARMFGLPPKEAAVVRTLKRELKTMTDSGEAVEKDGRLYPAGSDGEK